MNKRQWRVAGLLYFCVLFITVPATASAYIDPSITSYAIQAIAGIVIASGAFFAAYGRRAKRGWFRAIGVEENEIRKREQEVEVYDEDLKAELAARKAAAAQLQSAAGKVSSHRLRRVLLSLLCGFTVSLAVILRPVLSLYLNNEGEFWFPLSDVILCLLAVFCGAALAVALVHYLLPDRKTGSLRLLFTALCAAGSLCVFVQNHFLSSYLPVLTGDPIDWSQYSGWNIASLALWGGVFALFIVLVFVRPRVVQILGYSLLALLLCTEAVNMTIDLASATYVNETSDEYFTEAGLYETSTAGNVVVLISDTFEGTYMNAILEEYPEVRDLLSDCTYYDNVTGTSVFTYFSYAKIMTGMDFPIGYHAWNGVRQCFENETTLSMLRDNGWDAGYYTTFSPPASVKDKVINYSDEPAHPDTKGKLLLTKLLIRNSLFRSAPHFLKSRFVTFTQEYQNLKDGHSSADWYLENDRKVFTHLRDESLTAVDGKPRYTLVQLWGVHEPSHINADFENVEWEDNVPVLERKIQAGRAQLTLLRTYLDRLKEAGTYDDTTVILTADHGFNMRLYTTFIVKEAHRAEDGFRVDHTPLSVQDDYEDLLRALTSGQSFSDAVSGYADDSRVRTALDFRSSEGYKNRTTQRSLVEIRGDAADPDAYRYSREEYALDDDFTGRCEVNTPFISGSSDKHMVAVYGCYGTGVYGHSVVFDAFFRGEEERSLVFRGSCYNRTAVPQRVECYLGGEKIGETVVIDAKSEAVLEFPLPAQAGSRLTLELFLPDAVAYTSDEEALGWNDFDSIIVNEAGFYE